MERNRNKKNRGKKKEHVTEEKTGQGKKRSQGRVTRGEKKNEESLRTRKMRSG